MTSHQSDGLTLKINYNLHRSLTASQLTVINFDYNRYTRETTKLKHS